MATIHSLPPELLHRILGMGSPWSAELWERPIGSYEFLRYASLVSPAWRAAAQARLWRRVVICSYRQANEFTWNKVNGTRTTAELVVLDGLPLHVVAMLEAVEACDGLRTVGFESLTLVWEAFGSSKMVGELHLPLVVLPAESRPRASGVTSLLLVSVSLRVALPPPPFPFRLNHLLFDCPIDPLLLAELLQPSITSLSLDPVCMTKNHLPTLTGVAPQLTTVDILTWISVDILRPFFTACCRLSHLSCDIDISLGILPRLPVAVKELYLTSAAEGGMKPDHLQALSTLLRSNLVGVSGLRRIELRTDNDETEELLQELVSVCEKQEIVLEIVADLR